MTRHGNKGRRIAHTARGVKYHVGNSLRGLKRWIRLGYTRFDWDLQMTRDGVIVVTHWARPMKRDGFRDPRGLIRPGTPISRLTWVQVARLRAGRRPRVYKIRRIEPMLHHAARLGGKPVLEPKGDPRFEDPKVWEYVKTVADDFGCHIEVRALRNHPTPGAGARRVKAARAAGIRAWTI